MSKILYPSLQKGFALSFYSSLCVLCALCGENLSKNLKPQSTQRSQRGFTCSIDPFFCGKLGDKAYV